MAGKSSSSTPLARLRSELKLRQSEMADGLGCFLADYKLFESGRRPVPEKVGLAGQVWLGVSGQWILGAFASLEDGSIPDVNGGPWSLNAVAVDGAQIQRAREVLPWAVSTLKGIALSAGKRMESGAFTAALQVAIHDLAERFGVDFGLPGVNATAEEREEAMKRFQAMKEEVESHALAARKATARARLKDYCDRLRAVAVTCPAGKNVWIVIESPSGGAKKIPLSREQALDMATRGFTFIPGGRVTIAASAGGVGGIFQPNSPVPAPGGAGGKRPRVARAKKSAA